MTPVTVFTCKADFIQHTAEQLGTDNAEALEFIEWLEEKGFETTNDRGEWFDLGRVIPEDDWNNILQDFCRYLTPNAVVVRDTEGKMHNYQSMVELMDDETREELHMELCPCSDQKFFDEYCKRHEEKFGEVFPPKNY